jgi:hypothetical protein
MTNPFSQDNFDINVQNKIIVDPKREKEVYRLMIEAGWTSQEATTHIINMRRQIRNDKRRNLKAYFISFIIIVIIVGVSWIFWYFQWSNK